MKKWHLWVAASIGLVVIAGMMIREFDVEALSRIDLSPGSFGGSNGRVALCGSESDAHPPFPSSLPT